MDSETGNYYYNSRYYDPQRGRFISEDAIGFGGGDANLYRYVGNSPTNYTDPSGEQVPVAIPLPAPALPLPPLGGLLQRVPGLGILLAPPGGGGLLNPLPAGQDDRLFEERLRRGLIRPHGQTQQQPSGTKNNNKPPASANEKPYFDQEYKPQTLKNQGVSDESPNECDCKYAYFRRPESPDKFENRYATFVTKSQFEFAVFAPGVGSFAYDGRTPGTKDVWEVKSQDDNKASEIRDAWPLRLNRNLSKQVEARIRQINSLNSQKNTAQSVADKCGYRFRYAVRSQVLKNFIDQNFNWGSKPTVEHIPFE